MQSTPPIRPKEQVLMRKLLLGFLIINFLKIGGKIRRSWFWSNQ